MPERSAAWRRSRRGSIRNRAVAGFLRRADAVLLGIATALAAVLLCCVVLQVFYRYVLQDSLVWSDELARFCFVWSSLIAASVIVGRNDHFTIPIVVDLLGERTRARTELLCLLLFMAF